MKRFKLNGWNGFLTAALLAAVLQGCGSSSDGGGTAGDQQPIASRPAPGPEPVPTPAPTPTAEPQPGPTVTRIDLPNAGVAMLDSQKKTATLYPFAILLKLKTQSASANLGLLPAGDSLFARCFALRKNIKEELETGFGNNHGETLQLEAGYFKIEHDMLDSREALTALLTRRNLNYEILIPYRELVTKKFPVPALHTLQATRVRGWDKIEGWVGESLPFQNGSPLPAALSIGELCDLLANEITFTLGSEGTVIIFDHSN